MREIRDLVQLTPKASKETVLAGGLPCVKYSKRMFYDRSSKSNDKDDRDLTTADDGKPRVSALSCRYRNGKCAYCRKHKKVYREVCRSSVVDLSCTDAVQVGDKFKPSIRALLRRSIAYLSTSKLTSSDTTTALLDQQYVYTILENRQEIR